MFLFLWLTANLFVFLLLPLVQAYAIIDWQYCGAKLPTKSEMYAVYRHTKKYGYKHRLSRKTAHAWGAVKFRIRLAPKYHGNSISAQSYDFCSHLAKLNTLDFTLSHIQTHITENIWAIKQSHIGQL